LAAKSCDNDWGKRPEVFLKVDGLHNFFSLIQASDHVTILPVFCLFAPGFLQKFDVNVKYIENE